MQKKRGQQGLSPLFWHNKNLINIVLKFLKTLKSLEYILYFWSSAQKLADIILCVLLRQD